MKNLALILACLSLVVCSVGFWQISEVIAKFETQGASITQSESECRRLETARQDFSKEHAARYSRERRKNQELEEQLLDSSTQKTTLETETSDKNLQIDELKGEKEENEKQMVDLKVKLLGLGKELEAAKQKAFEVKRQIPEVQAKINEIEMECENQRTRRLQIEESLNGYNVITQVLKEHFDRTIDSLLEDKYERPWIEEGEMIKLSKFTLDLKNGLLGLPVGREIGLETGKFFSIANDGELICKVKIKESGQNRAVALIMPLFGNPRRLLEIQSFDLKHL